MAKRLGLGRLPSSDERDKEFQIKSVIPKKMPKITVKMWDSDGWWGDQGESSKCVGYSWAHFIEDGPISHEGDAPIIHPDTIYAEARRIDEWEGEDYDGTSVRAGAKYLCKEGKISSYLWAWDLDTLVDAVLSKGPVVVGTNWYGHMNKPNENGFIIVEGSHMGGHAYLINGVNTDIGIFRIKNSWGRKWGKEGHAYIHFGGMERLIQEDGEVCLAVENQF